MKKLWGGYLVSILRGSAPASTVVVTAFGAWWISIAATEPMTRTSQWLVLVMVGAGITQALLLLAGDLLSQSLDDKQFRRTGLGDVRLDWLSPLVVGLVGSGLVFYIEPAAGITTFVLVVFTLGLRSRLIRVSRKSVEIVEMKERLAAQVSSALSGNFEAKIFCYEDRIKDELQFLQSELAGREVRALDFHGLLLGVVYFIMGINIIINAIIGLSGVEQGKLEMTYLAILILMPLAIFESIARAE